MTQPAEQSASGVQETVERLTVGTQKGAPGPSDEPASSEPGASGPAEQWDAVVVGGGVAGLVAARELAVRGLRTLVLEAWTSPGGVVGRHVVDGLRLDAGAESFATRGGVVAELIEELGLADRIVTPEPHGAWVRLPSGAGPLPRTGLLGIPADPWAPDVRRTIGWPGAVRAWLDRALPASWGTGTADRPVSLGALVRARMGRRVLDRLVRPVVAGVHAAEPDDIAADAVAPGLRDALRRSGSLGGAVTSLRALAPAGSAVASLDGGLHVLVDALVADVVARGGEVRAGTRVTAVERGGLAAPPQFDVVAGDGPVVTTPRLVVATPEATRLLADVVPAVADLRTDAGADIVLVTLVLDAPSLDGAPRGTGVLVAREVTDVHAKALTHATAKWKFLADAAGPGRHVVRLSYGVAGDGRARRAGAGADPVDDSGRPGAAGTASSASATPTSSDASGDAPAIDLREPSRPEPDARPVDPRELLGPDLVALAVHDASSILGVPLSAAQVRASARVAWAQGLPVPSPAHRAAVEAVRAAVAPEPGLAVVGAWVAGNGLASVVPDARRTAAALADALPAGRPEIRG